MTLGRGSMVRVKVRVRVGVRVRVRIRVRVRVGIRVRVRVGVRVRVRVERNLEGAMSLTMPPAAVVYRVRDKKYSGPVQGPRSRDNKAKPSQAMPKQDKTVQGKQGKKMRHDKTQNLRVGQQTFVEPYWWWDFHDANY